MGSETADTLPIIDFSKEDLKPGSEGWESVKSQAFKALEEYGCFEAIFNKVPSDLKKGLIGCIEEVLQLPLQTKQKTVSTEPLHGYLGNLPHVPLYESLGIKEADILQNVDSFTSSLWPQGNPAFSKTVHSYAEKASELDKIVRRMMLESLGLEKYMEEHLNSANYLLRVMKYEAPQTQEAKLGISIHTDYTYLTILYQNQIEGLEFKTKNDEWIHVKPSPDSFVVLSGDSFLAWTNGRLHSPYHRVMMTGNKARYSCGLFSLPKSGYLIKAPEEMIDEQHPLLFKPFHLAEFLAFRRSEAGKKCLSPLHAFCGL